MLLGGLWHGAGWTFVAWGGLHGIYLIVNHGWRHLMQKLSASKDWSFPGGRLFSIILTFLAVVLAWVFFRAESFSGAVAMLQGMFGFNGVQMDVRLAGKLPDLFGVIEFSGLGYGSFGSAEGFGVIVLSALLIWGFPNTQQVVLQSGVHQQALGKKVMRLLWKPGLAWGLLVIALGVISISHLHAVSEFLYFNF